jgi:excinuclease UvrABC ATPase subunit
MSGGNVLFSGTPLKILKSQNSVTRPYIEESIPK